MHRAEHPEVEGTPATTSTVAPSGAQGASEVRCRRTGRRRGCESRAGHRARARARPAVRWPAPLARLPGRSSAERRGVVAPAPSTSGANDAVQWDDRQVRPSAPLRWRRAQLASMPRFGHGGGERGSGQGSPATPRWSSIVTTTAGGGPRCRRGPRPEGVARPRRGCQSPHPGCGALSPRRAPRSPPSTIPSAQR